LHICVWFDALVVSGAGIRFSWTIETCAILGFYDLETGFFF